MTTNQNSFEAFAAYGCVEILQERVREKQAQGEIEAVYFLSRKISIMDGLCAQNRFSEVITEMDIMWLNIVEDLPFEEP